MHNVCWKRRAAEERIEREWRMENGVGGLDCLGSIDEAEPWLALCGCLDPPLPFLSHSR